MKNKVYNMVKLKIPISREDIVCLKVGDEFLLSGTIFAARDKAHKFFLETDFEKIQHGIIYHCGPIIKNNEVIAAGPTTSARLNSYTPELIERYKIKAIIGKGGMDTNVLQALKGKAIYLAAIGGAGALYADKIKLKNIYKKEFGMAEAIYEMEIKDFPVIVAMDANGNSLYDDVCEKSRDVFRELINR